MVVYICGQRCTRMKMNAKKTLSLLFFVVAFVSIVFVYYCGDGSGLCRDEVQVMSVAPSVNLWHEPPSSINLSLETYRDGRLPYNRFEGSALVESRHVNIEKQDVIVFLHIQKTGGTTFGRHLVRNLDLKSPCKCFKSRKRCDCYTRKDTIWLFSRYSTGWMCGLHADWTELTSCVDGAMDKKEGESRTRKYHYITILRDPVKRYLSEWKHVQRGATWKTARLFCNGRSASLDEIAPCYNGSDWEDVTLDEFLNCGDNLARNRQTRMLADLTLANCYNTSSIDSALRDEIMLDSAKKNLLKMTYFGLTEFQVYTQKLFEFTFELDFIEDFSQLPVTHSDRTKISDLQKEKILYQNRLDIALYLYAKDLFLQRVRNMKKVLNDDTLIEDYQDDRRDAFDDSVDIAEDDDDDEDTDDV